MPSQQRSDPGRPGEPPGPAGGAGVRPSRRLIEPLTGIRGIAALWVVLYHQRYGIQQALPDWNALRALVGSGYLGVDLFAFLSGFVISHTYGERLAAFSWRGTGRFLGLRLARIYPLHVFVLGLFLVSLAGRQGPGALADVPGDASFWRQLLLVNGWGLETRFAWNVPSWTLSSEWLCYLCFPVVAPLLARVKRAEVAGALALWTFGLLAYLMYRVGRPAFDALLEFGLLRIGGEFLVGCWLYRAHQAGLGRGAPWAWISVVSLLGGFALCRVLPVGAVACFAVLVYGLAQDRGPLHRALGSPASVWLGEISYSIYMLHWLVLTEVRAILGLDGRLGPGPTTILLFALVVAASAATYRFVERPARRRLRTLLAGGAP